MKKAATLLAATLLAASLTACNNNTPNNPDENLPSGSVENPSGSQQVEVNPTTGTFTFSVVNKTDKTITGVFIAPVNDPIWSENLLASGATLEQDAEQQISYDYNTADAQWNVMVTTENDEVLYWTEVDFNGIESFELLPEGSQATL